MLDSLTRGKHFSDTRMILWELCSPLSNNCILAFRDHFCGPVFVIISYLLFIFPDVVNPSPSRPPLLLFPGTTMSIIFLERLSSLLLMCPYQFSLFCLRNVAIGYMRNNYGITFILLLCAEFLKLLTII